MAGKVMAVDFDSEQSGYWEQLSVINSSYVLFFLYRLTEVFLIFLKRNNWIQVVRQSSSSVNSDLTVLNVKGEPREKGHPLSSDKKLRVHVLLSWARNCNNQGMRRPHATKHKLQIMSITWRRTLPLENYFDWGCSSYGSRLTAVRYKSRHLFIFNHSISWP